MAPGIPRSLTFRHVDLFSPVVKPRGMGGLRRDHVVRAALALRNRRNRLDKTAGFALRPRIRRDYPLNLSISVSGGKETNQDSPSNGE